MREFYAYMGNFDKLGMFDWTDVSTTERDDTRPIVELPATAGHDLFGYTDAVSLSNHNYIAELSSAGHLPSFVQLRYHNATVWAYFADTELNDAETDIIKRLEDYPVLDEDRMSEIESGWVDEFWQEWATEHGVAESTFWDTVHRHNIETWPMDWSGASPWYPTEYMEDMAALFA